MDLFHLKDWKDCPTALDACINEVCIHSKLISKDKALFVCFAKEESLRDACLKEAYLNGASFALVEEGVENNASYPKLIHTDDVLRSLQSLASAYRKTLPCEIIAVMGSYGKTLLKDLLYTICKEHQNCVASPESFNSQIGVPLSIFNVSKEHQVAFIEAAASEPGEISILRDLLSPSGIAITTLDDTHPYIYKNDGRLKEEHLDLLQNNTSSAWAILDSRSCDAPKSAIYWDQASDTAPYLEIEPVLYAESSRCHFHFEGKRTTFSVPAAHPALLELMKIACKVAYQLGIANESLIESLKSYQFELRQREIWKSPTGSTFQNDPYVSCPQTFLNTLLQFKKLKTPGKKWVIFGGFKDLGAYHKEYYSVAKRLLKEAKIDSILIYSDKIPKGFTEGFSCIRHASLEESLKHLQTSLSFEDAILIVGEHKVSSEKISDLLSLSLARNQLLIDLTAIKQNIHLLKTKLGEGKRLMPIIKSQAYGTDSVIVGLFLESCGIDILGVAYVTEALQLRRYGIKTNIFVLHANESELEEVVRWDFEIAISDENVLLKLQEIAQRENKKIKVHLHVDTGMTRFGCPPHEALALARRIYFSSHIELYGLMTHFAQSEDPTGDGFTLEQAETLSNLHEALKKLNLDPPWIHAENSAAIARFSFHSFNMVRTGLALFGLQNTPLLPLKPALSLVSQVSALHICKKGDTVSYGRLYVVEKEHEKIAVIPLGYFDGIHRHYSQNGKVMIRNKLAPVVGSICMDFMMVNVTDIPNVDVGDQVLVFGNDRFGNEITPQAFAKDGQTIAHELITCLGPRIQRIFISDEHAHPIPQIKEQAQWTAKPPIKK